MVLVGGAFGRCLGHESRVLMNGISAPLREALERSAAGEYKESSTQKKALLFNHASTPI